MVLTENTHLSDLEVLHSALQGGFDMELQICECHGPVGLLVFAQLEHLAQADESLDEVDQDAVTSQTGRIVNLRCA